MSIHTNLEELKAIAIYNAKQHNCNYNIIIHNAVDGAFKEGESTYEFVRDSYFETDRPNCVLLHKTDDLINKNKIIGVLGSSGAGRSFAMQQLHKIQDVVIIDDLAKKMNLTEALRQGSETYIKYVNTRPMDDDFLYSHLTKKQREANIVDIRREPKIARNQTCPCGSDKKYKNCCLKNK